MSDVRTTRVLDSDARAVLRVVLREEASVGPGLLNSFMNWWFVRAFHKGFPEMSEVGIHGALERLHQLAEASGETPPILDAEARDTLRAVLIGPGLSSFTNWLWVRAAHKELKIPEARIQAALERLRQLAEESR
jgi:hypothetical protein